MKISGLPATLAVFGFGDYRKTTNMGVSLRYSGKLILSQKKSMFLH